MKSLMDNLKLVSRNPLALRECLESVAYALTLNNEAEGIGKENYAFAFKPASGERVILKAVDFDTLCELALNENHGLDLKQLKNSAMYPKGSVGNFHARSLERRLISLGLARRHPNDQDVYILSQDARTGVYEAETRNGAGFQARNRRRENAA